MSRHPLEKRLSAVRGRVRRLLAGHGLSWAVVGAILFIVVAALADWAIHLAPEVRLALLIALVGGLFWLLVRGVALPLLAPFRDLQVALKVEQHWPGLNDRLASTVQFLHAKEDGLEGSRELRDATIQETLKEVEDLDFGEVLDRRPLQRAVLAMLGTVLVATIVTFAAPGTMGIALIRLFHPLGATQWPRQTHLQIVSAPTKVARGDEFRFEVAVARGERLPTTGRVIYHFLDENAPANSTEHAAQGSVASHPDSAHDAAGSTATEMLRPEPARGRFHGRLESVRQSFTFEVAAGDDRTAPRAVQVVPPPTLTSLTLQVVPPEYTGHPSERLAPGRTQVQAVVGSRLEISATASKPLASSTLRSTGETPKKVPLEIAKSNPRNLSATLEITETGSYVIDLKDREGFSCPEAEATRIEVRAIADEPPRVVVEEPPNDRDVTPNATIPLTIVADDDFGLGGIRLLYQVAPPDSEPTKQEIVPLWSAEDAIVTHQQHDHSWALSPLKLTPGAVVTFHADARDRDTIHGPKLGKSRDLRLRVVTPEEIARQMEADQRDIRELIARIAEMQQQAITPVDEARRILKEASKVDPAGRDNLANAAVVQRQVGDRVTSKADGLAEKLRKFLQDLESLQIANPELTAQMKDLQAGAKRIQDEHLAPADQGLTTANKALEPQPGDASKPQSGPNAKPLDPQQTGDIENALAATSKNQHAIADELNRMLDQLQQFETFRGAVQDAKKLLQQQEELQKSTAEAAAQPDLISKKPDQLTPDEKSKLDNLGARQEGAAKALEGLEKKMDEMSGRLDDSDPLAAGALRDASKESRDKGTAGKMARSAEQIQKNQMGQAQKGQDDVRKDLKDLLDTLQNRREQELAKIVKDLRAAEKALKELHAREAKNKEATAKAKEITDAKERAEQLKRLAKEQEQIQQELKKQLARLQKNRADAAAKAGSKAAGDMAKAQQGQEADDAEDAEKEQEEALADLQQAEEETRQARKEAEEQLAREQLTKLADNLKGLADQQDKLVNETVDYDKKTADGQTLTPSQRASVRALGRLQGAIKQETSDLADKLTEAPVFALTLKKAVDSMDTAAERLGKLQTDAVTQIAERSAARRFRQLLDALKPEPPGKGGQQGGGGDGDGGGGGGGGDAITASAQIKMLKMLQQDINERTEAIDEVRTRQKSTTPEQDAELAQLQKDQAGVVDLARDLVHPKHDDGEED